MKGVLCKIEADCMGILKTTMAGMAVGKFWDVLVSSFGYDEDLADRPASPPPVPEERPGDLPARSQTTKAAAESGSKKKRKSGTPVRLIKKPRGVTGSPIPLDAAEVMFPTSSKRYHYTGSPGPFIGPRKSVRNPSGEIRGVYTCEYTKRASDAHELIPCAFINESRNQMAQHVREYHMGVALGCWICHLEGREYKVYGGKAWHDHMVHRHSTTHKEADFYHPAHLDLSAIQLADEVTLPDFLRLLSEQQPKEVVSQTTETSTSVEMKLEVPPTPVQDE